MITYFFFYMEGHKDLNKKLSAKCKQTVDLKKMLQIVEDGFNTQEINSAFDYDIVSSKDESVSSRITSSDETESGSENEDVSVIPPTPKKRKMTEFVQTKNSKCVTTCIKHVNQHVQGASGSNQSNICDLPEQPSLNTVSTDNTSPYQVTGPSVEHDKVPSSNTQPEPVFIIPLDTEVTTELQDKDSDFQLQDNQLDHENTTKLETPTILLQDSTTNLPPPPSYEQNHRDKNVEIPSDDDYCLVENDRPPSPPQTHLSTMQIVNCQGDTELQDNVENAWHRITHVVPPNNPQFTDTPGLNFKTNLHEPEVFFNQLFDD